jgi:cell division protein FtsI/penicillin-binding protein 2
LGSFLVGSHASASGSGWAVTQANIAVGSSRLIGPGHDLTALLAQYLPERHTDLALASVVEQFGLLAGIAILAAALILVWRLALAAKTSRSPPGALVASGLAVLLGVETVVSLGGNLGLLPLAGVPFPLLSYGGSALVVHLAAIGLALGVRRDGVRRRLWAQHGTRRPGWIRAAAFAISAVLVMFGSYGWRLHADDGPRLAAQGVDEMTRCSRLPAPRGEITDRHGVPLAVSSPDTQADVLAVPGLLGGDPAGLIRLAGLVGQSPDAVRAKVSAAPSPALAVPVAEVPAAAAAAVRDASISGVTVIARQRRGYPAGPVLGSLIGYTGIATPTEQRRWPDLPLGEVVGRAGLEQQYDAVLRGSDGSQCVYVNPIGEPVAAGPRTDPLPGADLRLSIDLGLQRVLSDELAAAMKGQGGRIGAAVALDPRNGQVLALASVPGYDDNIYGPPADTASLSRLAGTPGSPMRNHAVQSAVPPGSTFKLVVATANQLHPVWRPDQVIPTGASFSLGGHTFNNWKPMGPMNLTQALAWSNDVYFYKLALKLGPDAMIDAARALGVGAPTGIDLPSESRGYLGTPHSVHDQGATWYPGSTVIMGIGQGYLAVTPLQNARWTAAVATGQLVTPRLGLATGSGSTWAAVPAPPPRPLPFASSLAPIQEGMRAVVTGGTATRLTDLPAPVGAKTGTAQDGSLPDGLYDNWVTTATPVHAPSIVITVLTQGADAATAIGHDALAYYLAHKSEIEHTGAAQGP